MAIDLQMTATKLATAKLQVYNVCSLGHDIVMIKPGTKDEFGELLTESTLTLKAFPVRLTPYDRQVMQKISWAEDTDIMCYFSKLDLDNRSVTVENLKSYIELRFRNKTYQIKYADYYSGFGSDFLYAVVGAKI